MYKYFLNDIFIYTFLFHILLYDIRAEFVERIVKCLASFGHPCSVLLKGSDYILLGGKGASSQGWAKGDWGEQVLPGG